MTKIAINGLGRIGRKLTHLAMSLSSIEIVAINDIMPIEMACNLLKYDSTYGKTEASIYTELDIIHYNDKRIKYSTCSSIEDIPWNNLLIDIAINCSGTNKSKDQLKQYFQLGISKIILSSPPDSDEIPVIIIGYNEHLLSVKTPSIISNASCTTYCVAPIVDIINTAFGIDFLSFSTIHCYTSDQNLQDAFHSDFRRARAAAVNIIPTTTSATRVLKKIFPELENSIVGSSFRVPVINGSITEFVFTTNKSCHIDQVKNILHQSANQKYKNIIELTQDLLVSSDVLDCPFAALIDSNSIEMVSNNQLKFMAFYDNESGYTHRLIDLILLWDQLN